MLRRSLHGSGLLGVCLNLHAQSVAGCLCLSRFPYFSPLRPPCTLLTRVQCSEAEQEIYKKVAKFGQSSSPCELTDSVRRTPYFKTLGETHMFVIACSIPFNMQNYF